MTDEAVPTEGFGDVLVAVLRDVWDGRERQAYNTIAAVLRSVDRNTVTASASLIELATEWARIARDIECATAENIAWAQWAVTAAGERFGPDGPWTVRAELALAALLGEYGDDLAAAEQYSTVAARAGRLGNATVRIHARELRAVSLHNGGCCEAAINEMRRLAMQPPDVDVRPRGDYLAQIAAMLHGCGRTVEARLWRDNARQANTGRAPMVPAPIADIDPLHAIVCERQREQTLGTPLPKRSRRDDRGDLR